MHPQLSSGAVSDPPSDYPVRRALPPLERSSAAPLLVEQPLSLQRLVSLTFAGWISLGHSENKEAAATTLPADLKTKQADNVTAGPSTEFNPNALKATTGLVKFNITFAGQHTFGFHDASTQFGELKAAAPKESGVAYFGKPGEYVYYCSIPGHEAAGMHGTVTVTGPDVPLDKALTDAGNPPGAAGGKAGG